MNGLTATTDQFSFPSRELPQLLLVHIQAGTTGYWEHQFDRLADRSAPLSWNLGVTNGRIVYSGTRIWSIQSLLRLVQRYIFNTRHALVKPRFELLKVKADEKSLTPAQLLAEMKQARILDDAQFLKAIQTKLLNDLDIYLSMGNGEAKFMHEPDLVTQLPIAGFAPVTLLDEAMRRQATWEALKPQISSMSLVPLIDPAMMLKAKIPAGQQQRIENLVQSGNSLNSIAEEMARDPLEIADMFAKLVRVGVVRFTPPPTDRQITIMAIDDSPLMLTQFEKLVSAMGYSVAVCQAAEQAIEVMIRVKPAAVFIDLNMPGISGFELIKKIRQQPQLAAIPLAILTGEQKIANRWRAQWSGCEFLTKPQTAESVRDFQVQLEELLPKLLKTATALSTKSYFNN